MVPELILAKPLLARLIARQYPVIFVDESQDTLAEVVECLKHVSKQNSNSFCLGFFGDPMQKIYVRGVGDIALEENWQEVEKPENFRSPLRVLDVINAIRKEADQLNQVSGLPKDLQRIGEVTFFVLPADETRSATLRSAREWLAHNSSIGAWAKREGRDGTKVLVIAHRMAARRLAFEKLYETFHSSRTFRDAFDEGRAWPVAPFLTTIMPVVEAAKEDRSKLVPLLRASSPLLQFDSLTAANTRDRLKSLSSTVDQLTDLVRSGGIGSVGEVLQTAREGQVLELDARLASVLGDETDAGLIGELRDDAVGTILQFLDCDVRELQGYFRYIDRESPYSTHQGVKGAEYPDVLVVLDDEEGRHNQFSYDKLLKIKAPSQVDLQRQEAGQETVVDRTRRLLYVCASRATEALAIALYARDTETAIRALQRSGIPGARDPVTVDDLTTVSG
jgi:DNA helicase-2/ATP-dependent DNA helicase PcrA